MRDHFKQSVRCMMLLAIAAAMSAVAGGQPVPNRSDSAPQPQGGFAGRPAFGGDFGGRGGGFLDDVKQQIKASDEEWKVIGPKLQKVIMARQVVEADRSESILSANDARGGQMFGAPGRGPGGGAFVGPGAGFGGPPGGGRGGFRGPAGGDPGGDPAGGPGGFGPPPGAPGGGGFGPPGGFDGPPGGAGDGPGMPGGRGGFGGRRAGFGGPGGPGGFGGPRGGPGGGPFGRMDPIGQAQSELKAVLDDPKSTAEQIQEKVAAVRKVTQKARAELATAQKDLLELLTADQEIVLVSLGYLD